MKYKKFSNNIIIHGDCIEAMNTLISKNRKVDLVLTDPPFQTSACTTNAKWDKQVPFDLMWECLEKLIKPNQAIILFATQPFTSKLIMSNIKLWKYNWIWKKEQGTNFLNSKYQPLKIYEDICVFGTGATSYTKNGESLIYNPQMIKGKKPYKAHNEKLKDGTAIVRTDNFTKTTRGSSNGDRYPVNILEFNRDKDKYHPTQKPVALLEYLIRTYSNEGDIVLDFTAGSFSTAVACINTNRKFVGIEKEEKYVTIGIDRIVSTLEGLNGNSIRENKE